jgi:hypothetical protein
MSIVNVLDAPSFAPGTIPWNIDVESIDVPNKIAFLLLLELLLAGDVPA